MLLSSIFSSCNLLLQVTITVGEKESHCTPRKPCSTNQPAANGWAHSNWLTQGPDHERAPERCSSIKLPEKEYGPEESAQWEEQSPSHQHIMRYQSSHIPLVSILSLSTMEFHCKAAINSLVFKWTSPAQQLPYRKYCELEGRLSCFSSSVLLSHKHTDLIWFDKVVLAKTAHRNQFFDAALSHCII